MLAHERRQRRRHHAPAEAEAAADPKQAARFAPRGADLFDQMVHVVQHPLRPVIDAFPAFADDHAARGAVEQLDAQAFLHQADALGDISGRHAQVFRGLGKAGRARHGVENAEVGGEQVIIHNVCIVNSRHGPL
ncbi:hypothetical protein D3C72_1783570 [compost metagenome]